MALRCFYFHYVSFLIPILSHFSFYILQPLIHHFQEMYGFSEYWYTMDDILKIGGHYREEKFIKGAAEFCSTPWTDLNNR